MTEGQALQQQNTNTSGGEAPVVGRTVTGTNNNGEGAITFTDVFPSGTTPLLPTQGVANGERLLTPVDGRALPVPGSDGTINQIEKIKMIEHGQISMKKFGPKETEPTPEERKEAINRAQKSLENNPLFKLMSADDQKAALKLQDAVLNGDTKALGELVKALGANPERMAALAGAIADNLKKVGANTQLDMGPDGSLLMYRDGASHAVQIGKDGSAQVRAIEHHPDGSLDILNDRTVVRPTAAQLARSISDSAVNQSNWNAMFSRQIQSIPKDIPPIINRPRPQSGSGGLRGTGPEDNSP